MSRAALRRFQAQSSKRVRVQQLPAPRPQSRAAGVVSDGGCRGCWLSVTPLAALAPHPHAPHHRAVIAATSYRSPLHRLPRHAACGAVSQYVFCSWRDTAASSTAPLPPHNFSRAAVRDVDVAAQPQVAAPSCGREGSWGAPPTARTCCCSSAMHELVHPALPCPFSFNKSIYCAAAQNCGTPRGKGGESRCAAPATFETWTTRNTKGNERGKGRKEE